MSDKDVSMNGSSFELVESSDGAVPAHDAPAGSVDFPPPGEETGGVDLRRYMAAVLRHKWLILALGVAAGIGGYFAADYLPEEYQAQATVWIESSPGGDRGPIRTGELLQSGAWIELLRSFVVLDRVVLEERLYLEPASSRDSDLFDDFGLRESFVPGEFRLRVSEGGDRYQLQTQEGAVVEQGRIGEPIGAAIGFDWQPQASVLSPRMDVAFQVAVPREAAVDLNRRLQTRMDQNANFLRLELRHPTAEGAARVLNAITERYVDVASDLKRSRLDERTAILEEQLQYAESNLREAERALQSFKVSTIVLPSERGGSPVAPGLEMTQDPVFGRYFDMRVELEQLRRDREAIARAIARNEDPLTTATSLEAIPAVARSSALTGALAELTAMQADLRTLLYRYTDEHAAVQELEADFATLRRQTIPALARTLMTELAAREEVLEEMIGSAGGELQDIPPRMIEEARLTRHVAIAEALYRNLEERVQESRLSAASAIPDISILDRASAPRSPVQDDKPRLIFMALIGGLGLGILGAVLRERLDASIRYPDQVSNQLGIAILGAMPKLKTKKGRLTGNIMAEGTEALRGIRLNLSYAHGAGPILTTISSPAPGDGKSLVATNLAVSFADLGRRTLLIDGDVRKGTIHDLLQRERMPGLTDHLAGRVALDEVVQGTAYEGLDVIPCGRRARNAPELVDSAAMRRLVLEMRTRYDVILVDSAPLGAGVDPYVLGTLTGSMVLVFRTGQTDQDLSEAKLALLDRLPIRLLGAVMNGITHSMAGYRYYQYYSYLPDYGAEDELEDDEPKQLQNV